MLMFAATGTRSAVPLNSRVLASARTYATIPKPGSKLRHVPASGTYPAGFLVGSVHCGVKKHKNAASEPPLDLVAVTSSRACSAAAVFTKNVFAAAPVQVCKQLLPFDNATQRHFGSGIHSLLLNSGCANAVTGEKGMADAWKMSQAMDKLTGHPKSTLVMSTGVIGQHLPIEKIERGAVVLNEQLGSDHEHWLKAARGFMTTDTFAKFTSAEYTVAGANGSGEASYRMAGIAKGAGMIHPNMATLLGVVCTDAAVTPECLSAALSYATDRSFNSISVDGDTSTNDSIAVLANGASVSNAAPITSTSSDAFVQFRDNLTKTMVDLSKLVVRDGEGATKFVTIRVNNAATFADAQKIAMTIATSSLVKTALYGEDANWGRILCAVGYSGVPVDPKAVSLSFVPPEGFQYQGKVSTEKLQLLTNGEPHAVDEVRAKAMLSEEDVNIVVDLGSNTGKSHSAEVYTCDFSHEYVTINGDYRS
ncbi:arginine biosynthesis protein ArgJ [Ramicandelaber brevisporus]|nr:arginine biosynthesis protein ArgJ [Ramicandelaber brevisporus]